MIKLVIFDIDGVLTDGTVIVSEDGREQKKINLRDTDAVYQIHREGYKIAAITGEDSEIVGYFEKKFPWEYFVKGCKNKVEAIKDISRKTGISKEEICYIGDGKYDVEPLLFAGLGICPGDAIDDAKKSADIILKSAGGTGGLWEVVSILKSVNSRDKEKNYFYKKIFSHTEIFKKMAADVNLTDMVMKVSQKIAETQKVGGQVFLCGSRGSAAAVSNDFNYERMSVRQLEAKAGTNDMVIGISEDGKSQNVTEALKYAKKNHIYAVMLMGDFQRNELDQICDVAIKVPSTDTQEIQEAHIFIGHLMAEYAKQVLCGSREE